MATREMLHRRNVFFPSILGTILVLSALGYTYLLRRAIHINRNTVRTFEIYLWLRPALALASGVGFLCSAVSTGSTSEAAADVGFGFLGLFLIATLRRPKRLGAEEPEPVPEPVPEVLSDEDVDSLVSDPQIMVLEQGPVFATWPSLLLRGLTVGRSERFGYRPRLLLTAKTVVVDLDRESRTMIPLRNMLRAWLQNLGLFGRVMLDLHDPPRHVVFDPVRISRAREFLTELDLRRSRNEVLKEATGPWGQRLAMAITSQFAEGVMMRRTVGETTQLHSVRVSSAEVVEVIYSDSAGSGLKGIRIDLGSVQSGPERVRESTPDEIASDLIHLGMSEPRPMDEFLPPDSNGVRWLPFHRCLDD